MVSECGSLLRSTCGSWAPNVNSQITSQIHTDAVCTRCDGHKVRGWFDVLMPGSIIAHNQDTCRELRAVKAELEELKYAIKALKPVNDSAFSTWSVWLASKQNPGTFYDKTLGRFLTYNKICMARLTDEDLTRFHANVYPVFLV